MSNLKQYEPWTAEQMAKELDDLDAEKEFLTLPVGVTQLRILPKRVGTVAPSPLVKTFQHYLDMPGMANGVSFCCPRMMAKRACPVCRKVDELRATGNSTDFDLAGEMRAGKRVYANAVLRAHPERGPVIWPFGKLIHDDLMALLNNKEWGDWSDPTENGYDIIISREGTSKKDTRYRVNGARECSPLSASQQQVTGWLACMHDLDRFLRVPSDVELARMLPGIAAPVAALGRGPERPKGARAQDDVEDISGAVRE